MDRNNPTADRHACYQAFKAHDPRFDGRIFVCVTSTGIYCRPVCRVRMPREENCSFVPSAAAAEAAGYRPCLKCRPELAPGSAPVDAPAGLARRAALLMEDARFLEDGIAGIAAFLGVTDRHLRRVFTREFGVSPVRHLQTRRLLLAKHLLTDSALPVTEIAFAAGFGSIRRLNALFRKHYRLPPTALRKNAGRSLPEDDGGIRLFLGYRPPYAWDSLLAFLEHRAIAGVEEVCDGVYRRTLAVPDGSALRRGWLAVRHAKEKNALAVTIAPELSPVLPAVLARVRHLFDLDCDPAAVYDKLRAMNTLQPGLCLAGTRLPGCVDPFEMAVRAVLGQQITVKAARTLAERLAHTFGQPLATPFPGLSRVFPTPETILALDGGAPEHLGPLGIIRSRARSIRELAGAMVRGEITLSPAADPGPEVRRLLALPGFGPWTAQYLAMRTLGWPDAFPDTDYGVRKALGNPPPRELAALAEAWRPWRAYAAVNLWNSL